MGLHSYVVVGHSKKVQIPAGLFLSGFCKEFWFSLRSFTFFHSSKTCHVGWLITTHWPLEVSVNVWPCNEPVNCPEFAPPSPCSSWDGFQQGPVTLHRTKWEYKINGGFLKCHCGALVKNRLFDLFLASLFFRKLHNHLLWHTLVRHRAVTSSH